MLRPSHYRCFAVLFSRRGLAGSARHCWRSYSPFSLSLITWCPQSIHLVGSIIYSQWIFRKCRVLSCSPLHLSLLHSRFLPREEQQKLSGVPAITSHHALTIK